MVGLGLVMLLQSSFVGTKSVGIVSVGIVWCARFCHSSKFDEFSGGNSANLDFCFKIVMLTVCILFNASQIVSECV